MAGKNSAEQNGIGESVAVVDAEQPTIVITRLIAAPVRLVWEAFTRADYLARWWGPDGFSITTRDFAFRVGGSWTFVMHGPDGVDYPNVKLFKEIVPGERIVSTHGNGQDVQMKQTMELAARGERTQLTMTLRFADVAARDVVAQKYGAVQGGQQTLARLAREVELRAQSVSPTI